MPRPVGGLSLALLLTALASPAGAVSGRDLQPLEVGHVWTFVGDGANLATLEVVGTAEVLGVETTLILWTFQGPLSGVIETFWSERDDGALLMHGFHQATWPVQTVAYVPPLVYLPASVSPGDAWCMEVGWHTDLEGTTELEGPRLTCYIATREEELTVPAGTFRAVGLGSATPRIPLPGVGTARGLGGGPGEAIEWRAPGVGIVLLDGSVTYRLSGFAGDVPTAEVTWGEIKSLYGVNR